MKTIQQQTRAQIAEFLPNALERALTSYFEFSKSASNEKECKDFANRHSAAKAAIAHVELLVKLAKWADIPDAETLSLQRRTEIKALMNNAQKEIDESER